MAKGERRLYPTNYGTDLSDEQWAAVESFVMTTSAKGGRPPEIDLRAIVNALIYKNRTGCQWRLLPADFPPMGAVRYYFDKWNADGTFIKLNDALRKSVRKAMGREEEPSNQCFRFTINQDNRSRWRARHRREKKVNGRKRQFWVDTNDLLLRVLVHPATISDIEGAEWLLAAHHTSFPHIEEVRVDEGYKNGLDEWMEKNIQMRLTIIEKPVGQKGFAVIPKRWVVERSIACSGRTV